jgi:hypothetical protein
MNMVEVPTLFLEIVLISLMVIAGVITIRGLLLEISHKGIYKRKTKKSADNIANNVDRLDVNASNLAKHK